MVMNLRLSNSCLGGSRQIHCGRKKKAFDLFFDILGIVHKEFVPSGQTVNGKIYCEGLKQLREAIWRKRLDKWKNNWFLHHNNAPLHTSLVVRQFLTSKYITVIPHIPPPLFA
jgi:hypothetical protein